MIKGHELRKIGFAGLLLVGAGVLFVVGFGDGLPNNESDAVRYRCVEDRTEFQLTPSALKSARIKSGSTLGMAPCPTCNKPTGQRLIQNTDGTWVPLLPRNEGVSNSLIPAS